MKLTTINRAGIAVFIAMLLFALPAYAGVTGSFTAEVLRTQEGNDLKFNFIGDFKVDDGRLKVETSHPLTFEDVIMIATSSDDTLALLYPDTLNGERSKLSSVDRNSYILLIEGFLAGNAGLPTGWEKEKLESSGSGKGAEQYRIISPSGGKGEYWVNDAGQPTRLNLSFDATSIDMWFSDHKESEIDDSEFVIEDKFTITEMEFSR